MANTIYVNVNGTWKQANAYYVNVNGTWKTGSEFQVKVSSSWKGGTAAAVGLPTLTEVLGLDFVDFTLPSIGAIDSNSSVSSLGLDFVDFTLPFFGKANPSTGLPVTTNLVLYLDASITDSYSGSGTTWSDLSSNSNDGTLTNGAVFDSGNNGSIVFDGTNDRVSFSSDMFNPNANFTVSAWVNTDITDGTHTVISDVDETGSFQLRYESSGWQIVDNHVVAVGTFSNSTILKGFWYNVTVTRSGNTYTLYLNGSSISSFTSSNTYDGGAQDIGVNYNNLERWDGKIAQLLAYSSVLSSSDVLSNYNALKSKYTLPDIITTNLVFYFDVNNNACFSSGSTVKDLTSNDNNGTLTNGASVSSHGTGSAIVFDGSDDYVQLGSDMFNPNSNFTITLWVNLDATTGTYTMVSDSASLGSFQLRYNSGVQIVDSYVVDVGTFSSSTLSAATWYELTVTRSSNTYTLYINGSSNSSYTNTNVYDRGAQSIGTNYNNTENFDGKIAQVFAYDAALSAANIASNYNSKKSRYGH